MATTLPAYIPAAGLPVFKVIDGKLTNTFTDEWYSYQFRTNFNAAIMASVVDATPAIDGTILVGNTATGKYHQTHLLVNSNKILVTEAAAALSIDAIEANFTLNNIGGILSLAKGGANKALVAANGGVVYSDADSLEILAPTATALQMFQSGASSAPSWSTATYPATTTINQILYSSSANTVAGITTDNNGVLITSAGGVPSISSTLPSAVQANITVTGTIVTGVWNGSIIGLAYGGTNKAITADNGAIVYSDADSFELLAATNTALRIVQSGANAAPTWSTATYPATTTVNRILFSSSTNVIDQITTDNSKVLITSSAGVPSFSTSLYYDNANTRLGIGAAATTYALEVNKDTDNAVEIGRAHIGYGTISDYAWFSHLDMVATGSYGIIQNGNGATFINAASGQTLSIRINNTNVSTFTSSAATITPNCTMSGSLTMSGDVSNAILVSGTKTVVASSTQYGIRTSATFSPVSDASIFGASYVNDLLLASGRTSATAAGTVNRASVNTSNLGAITVLTACDAQLNVSATAGGTIGTAYVFRGLINGVADAGIATTSYMAYFPKPDFATNKYCAYMEGPVGIGTTTPTETLHVSGSIALKRTATAVTMSVGATDYLIAVTSTAAARTITLPSSASTTVGRTVIVKDESGACATNNITVDTAGGNIDGAASKVMNVNYESLTFYNNGTNWFII